MTIIKINGTERIIEYNELYDNYTCILSERDVDWINHEIIKKDDVLKWLLNEIHRSGAPLQIFREFKNFVKE